MHMQMTRHPKPEIEGPVKIHPWRHRAGKAIILLGFLAVYILILGTPMSLRADAQLAILAFAVIALGTMLL